MVQKSGRKSFQLRVFSPDFYLPSIENQYKGTSVLFYERISNVFLIPVKLPLSAPFFRDGTAVQKLLRSAGIPAGVPGRNQAEKPLKTGEKPGDQKSCRVLTKQPLRI